MPMRALERVIFCWSLPLEGKNGARGRAGRPNRLGNFADLVVVSADPRSHIEHE